jgi:DNA replication and repair protein RecF
MTIEQILLTQFRHFERCHFSFDAKDNLIVGQNGSGKTSVLEAVYFLAYAKSFRTSSNRALIGHHHDRFQIDAKICTDDSKHVVQSIYGVDKSIQTVRLDHESGVKQSVLARHLPVVFVDASTHRDFAATPKNRRDFLNWCCFYTMPEYHSHLSRFQRALQQRNQLLKQCRHYGDNRSLLATWTDPLIFYAEKVHAARQALIERLNEQLLCIWPHFLAMKPGQITYEPGWRNQMTYAECLDQTLQQDMVYGFTQCGPHRGDLSCLTADGHSIFQGFSQGQQKLFAYMIKCIQLTLLNETDFLKSILLIDDLAAELDDVNQSRVLDYLKTMPCQKFLTALNPAVFSNRYADHALFVDQIVHSDDGHTPAHAVSAPI